MMRNGKFATGSGVLMSLAMVSGAFAQAPAAASAPAMSGGTSPVMHFGMACAPGMPQQAARAGAQGTSRIRFYVDASGKVTAAEIVESSGPTREHRMLDNAAGRRWPSARSRRRTTRTETRAPARPRWSTAGCSSSRDVSTDQATLIGITRPRSDAPPFVAASPPRPCHLSSNTRHCARPVARLPSFTWP